MLKMTTLMLKKTKLLLLTRRTGLNADDADFVPFEAGQVADDALLDERGGTQVWRQEGVALHATRRTCQWANYQVSIQSPRFNHNVLLAAQAVDVAEAMMMRLVTKIRLLHRSRRRTFADAVGNQAVEKSAHLLLG